MKQTRIKYSTWGSQNVDIPDSYAMMTDNDLKPMDAVKRSIERKTGWYFSIFRPANKSLTNGKLNAKHYRGVLCSGNNSVEAQIWVAIPVIDRRQSNGHDPDNLPKTFHGKPKWDEPTTRVSLRIPKSILKTIDEQASRRKIKRSEHIVSILRDAT